MKEVAGAASPCRVSSKETRPTTNRRGLLVGTAVAAVGAIGYALSTRIKSTVFIARGQRYDGSLVQTIRDGLSAIEILPAQLAGKRVLLKPNMVEPMLASPQMTTHPAMVSAATEVFRSWGAKVAVGEGPGHVRDTEMALFESRIQNALDRDQIDFRDLNYEEVTWVKNRGGVCPLNGFWFPRSVVEADLIVSLPKLKTHHWVGLTASMKNLYGTIPGSKYGWPKNVLHHAGIPETVIDINASLPKSMAIVDGILCMEGDGPIMGSPKHLGVVAISSNPTAVDATLARIMGLSPDRIPYLALAKNRLGPLCPSRIIQRGEAWEPLVSPFEILDYPHLQSLRSRSVGPNIT